MADILSTAPPTLTVEDVAKRWHVAKSYVHKLTSTRTIPHYRVGRRCLFRASEVDTWFAARTRREVVA